MQQSLHVGSVQRRGDLSENGDGTGSTQSAFPLKDASQVGAVDVLHVDEKPAVDLTGVIHGHHVGVMQRGRQPGLLKETRLPGRVGAELGPENFQRVQAAQSGIADEVDLAHSSSAQLFDDGEPGEVRSWLEHAPHPFRATVRLG